MTQRTRQELLDEIVQSALTDSAPILDTVHMDRTEKERAVRVAIINIDGFVEYHKDGCQDIARDAKRLRMQSVGVQDFQDVAEVQADLRDLADELECEPDDCGRIYPCVGSR